ncbi:MAG TPA: bifunctional diguanylate cyclase/phosphodiesterase, partial [Microthrixaceae bacterium]|nr:bifunctional diguanylate cyclase/phosphodiesterase [Microthrixaceae bacterium]
DRTEQALAREQLALLEAIDPLTGLLSRSRIAEHAQSMIDMITGEADGGVNGHQRVGVLHVDLDDFRSVNDTFGSPVGDQVLVTLAERFNDLESRHVKVGRIGVDEFLIVATGNGASLEFDSRLRRLADEVQRRIDRTFDIEGLELRFTSSIGISRFPGNGEDSEELLRTADAARAAARRDGQLRVRLYDDSVDKRSRTSIALDRDLRRAAAQRTLDVYYQPIIDLRTGNIAAAEALLRWHHPEHGPISPAVFIPTAEATGAISSISDMVICTVAEDLAGWNRANLMPVNARIAINISSTEFEQKGFIHRLISTIDNAGVPAEQLELEVTETLLMRDMEVTALRLKSLADLGFLVALDDFGTGYSSLSYLHTLPLHTLKVDRCFVTELGNGRSETITKAILALAQSLGIGTVAEGVETDMQRNFLHDQGCDMVQGYYYAPPLPRQAFEEFLGSHSPVPAHKLPAYSAAS